MRGQGRDDTEAVPPKIKIMKDAEKSLLADALEAIARVARTMAETPAPSSPESAAVGIEAGNDVANAFAVFGKHTLTRGELHELFSWGYQRVKTLEQKGLLTRVPDGQEMEYTAASVYRLLDAGKVVSDDEPKPGIAGVTMNQLPKSRKAKKGVAA